LVSACHRGHRPLTPLAAPARPQAGDGIAISGLPAVNDLAEFNATYAPTGAQVAGFQTFSAGPEKHLFRHPGRDEWHLSHEPFDPAATFSPWVAAFPAAGGPVPTGARAWRVADGRGVSVTADVTAREVAY
jgi:hypothetical protein